MLEIEIKAYIADPDAMKELIVSGGGLLAGKTKETDYYYNHPSRDFAKTGEAFRVRVADDGARITYKGPKLGGRTKTRVERETGIDDAETVKKILEALGFIPVGVVSKKREYYQYEGATVTIDNVETLGHFIEIEMTGDSRDTIEPRVLAIAEKLHVDIFEQRSYLAMILGVHD
jgi:adenylate cyclase, class 2